MNDSILTAPELQSELLHLPGWELRNGKLYKEFQFPDFVAAWGFMSKVALIAESQGHHPEWKNIYNKVEINLFTHDTNGITKKDIELAHSIEVTV